MIAAKQRGANRRTKVDELLSSVVPNHGDVEGKVERHDAQSRSRSAASYPLTPSALSAAGYSALTTGSSAAHLRSRAGAAVPARC